jgi:hypothetical protein
VAEGAEDAEKRGSMKTGVLGGMRVMQLPACIGRVQGHAGAEDGTCMAPGEEEGYAEVAECAEDAEKRGSMKTGVLGGMRVMQSSAC